MKIKTFFYLISYFYKRYEIIYNEDESKSKEKEHLFEKYNI